MARKGRLLEAAKYHPGDFQKYLAYEMEAAQLFGDTHKINYLQETFGIRPVTDEDFKKIAERVRRTDPEGIGSRLLLMIMQAEENKESAEVKRLKKLYGGYQALPEESRASSIAVKDILCQAIHKKSYFDYPRGKSPVEEFFSQ